MDMSEDLFAEESYGKLALQKIGSIDPNFRLYQAGWLGEGNEREIMRVTGAVFREALKGPNKGQLSIKIGGTERSVFVTAREMKEYDAAHPGNEDVE